MELITRRVNSSLFPRQIYLESGQFPPGAQKLAQLAQFDTIGKIFNYNELIHASMLTLMLTFISQSMTILYEFPRVSKAVSPIEVTASYILTA